MAVEDVGRWSSVSIEWNGVVFVLLAACCLHVVSVSTKY